MLGFRRSDATTGTPLLRADKKSIEVFGPYTRTSKFDEAVRDGVVLDPRYEARDIDPHLTSPSNVDGWFGLKTRGLTDLARAQPKQRWGTLRKVLSSRSRPEMIVDDILVDMARRPRLAGGRSAAGAEHPAAAVRGRLAAARGERPRRRPAGPGATGVRAGASDPAVPAHDAPGSGGVLPPAG
jgi:hypothetical protein